MLGNQIDLLATTLGGPAAAQMASGKLKGLGLAADKRMPRDTECADLCRAGVSGIHRRLLGRASSRRPRPIRKILATLNSAINDIIKTPEVQKKLIDFGFDPIVGFAAGRRSPVQCRNRQMGQDGQGAGAVDQIAT